MGTARISHLAHDEAMALQAVELDRTIEFLSGLTPEEWAAPTECPGWDVRTMYLHVLGACEAGASRRENLRQMRRAMAHRKRHGGPLEAALSAVQIEARRDLAPDELLERLIAIAPGCIRGRTRTPAVLRRRLALGVDGPVVERWTLGYLVDTIYLRDLWMHRIDAHHSVGREPVLTAGHDGRIVADVADEWIERQETPAAIVLTGPAGGTFGSPSNTPLAMDAIDFCRVLAGRDVVAAPDEGSLAVLVPF